MLGGCDRRRERDAPAGGRAFLWVSLGCGTSPVWSFLLTSKPSPDVPVSCRWAGTRLGSESSPPRAISPLSARSTPPRRCLGSLIPKCQAGVT